MEWINYHHLLYFWSVAKHGTVTKACEELRLAQPTISGQIHLLDADSEFRLAARIEALVRVQTLTHHVRQAKDHTEHYHALFREVISDLSTAWKRLQEDADRIGQQEYPHLALMLAEAIL